MGVIKNKEVRVDRAGVEVEGGEPTLFRVSFKIVAIRLGGPCKIVLVSPYRS